MLHVFRRMGVGGALAVLALLAGAQAAMAQNNKNNKGDAVHIDTVDGVRLHGMFYPSGKKNAPTIIFLHKIGDKGLQNSYYNMAAALQPNYSVMLFDFRGHGKSKDIVSPKEFWQQPFNSQNIRGAKRDKTSLEHNEFSPRYMSALVNDIAAVKAYLDRRNDARDCNTASTVLIGAESGATLGAIWLNAQWSLTRMIGDAKNPLVQPQPAPNPEGKDVIACIWMSVDSALAKGNAVKVTDTLRIPVGLKSCPTVFMYGEANSSDKSRAHALLKALKKNDKQYEFVVPYGVPGTKLRGMNMAVPSLHLEKIISGYLDEVVEKRGGEWSKRDFENSAYIWNGGRAAKILAPGVDPKNLRFDTYEIFIGR